MDEKKFSGSYKTNDYEMNMLREKTETFENDIGNSVSEQIISPAPVEQVKKKSVPKGKIVAIVVSVIIFATGLITGIKFASDRNSDNNSIVSEPETITAEEIKQVDSEKQEDDSFHKEISVSETESNITEENIDINIDMDRYYGFWDNMFYATNLPYNENAEFYGCDEKWIIPLLLRNIYIDENEMLVGLFDEPFDLSKAEIEEHTDAKYYYISDIPDIKGVPDDSMPYLIKILDNSNGFISEDRPHLILSFVYSEKLACVFKFMQGKYMNNSEIQEIKENIKEYGLTQ